MRTSYMLKHLSVSLGYSGINYVNWRFYIAYRPSTGGCVCRVATCSHEIGSSNAIHYLNI